MFLFVLGAVVGLFVAMVMISLLSVFKLSLDIGILTNIIIAAATIVAVYIHYDSHKKLRQDRIWEINKDLLLDLIHYLSGAINATRAEIDNLHLHPNDNEIKVDRTVFTKLDKKISYALNVYRPLMDNELISKISNLGKAENRIEAEVFEEDLDHIEAYNQLIEEYELLYKTLQQFIVELSGVDKFRI